MTEIIDYILQFLVDDTASIKASRYVGYTSDKSEFSKYKIVIFPSNFFDKDIYGTKKSEPILPLKEIENIPVIYGNQLVERVNDTLVVYADFVASTYFLITRYEEILHREIRDEHGRFIGKKSLPFRANFIARPIVDEYGMLLQKWLYENGVEVPELKKEVRKIYLTHDVDQPFECRTWRQVARKILKGNNPINIIKKKFQPLENDDYYTFPWMFEQNEILQKSKTEKKCETLVFIKSNGKTKQDKPLYNLQSRDFINLCDFVKKHNATIGLHASYQSSKQHKLFFEEKKKLERALKINIKNNRNHFLASREPEDMQMHEDAGITDDFTMGYADVAGFRLGTSKPVRFINPIKCELTSLILHPLIIMDCTLNEKKYMNLSEENANKFCKNIIDNIKNVNGEITLLWHNTSISQQSYLKKLYVEILKYLI